MKKIFIVAVVVGFVVLTFGPAKRAMARLGAGVSRVDFWAMLGGADDPVAKKAFTELINNGVNSQEAKSIVDQAIKEAKAQKLTGKALEAKLDGVVKARLAIVNNQAMAVQNAKMSEANFKKLQDKIQMNQQAMQKNKIETAKRINANITAAVTGN